MASGTYRDDSRPWWAWLAGGIAIVFGVATILSGGQVLFGNDAARAAGFAYIVAGAGLMLWRRWAALLALAIATATVLVEAAFGVHILGGGAYEMRTVAALALRSAVWISISIIACRALGCWLRMRLSG